MSKSTGWVIVATAGATVDGRTITDNWIKDMADQYSTDEYTALIWPEHFRSSWAPFDGKNWGTVDEVKAAKFKDKLRLFAKLTANDYLLEANKEGQKLFTSIEPNPDYKGKGRCYLMGLAVTDSPASTGTTRLKFSIGENTHEREYSQMEELKFSDFIAVAQDDRSTIAKAFSTLAEWFSAGGETPIPHSTATPHDEETDVTEEQLKAALAEQLKPFNAQLESLQEQVNQFSAQPPADPPKDDTEGKTDGEKQGDTSSNFSQLFASELEKQLNPLTEKLNGLQDQFNELKQEKPGQSPDQSGTGSDTMEVF
ncbi:GPO family capsid scaffolding protein [Photobacterium sp. 53610]|uniref:GPO family capsid scaffolding protein n=1 Tax=Photobacterium sp. 53610 TaxID=3102789 RepID=UPI002ED88C4E